MLLAMACYVSNDTFVKLIADRLPPGQILAVRGAFASVLVIAATARAWGGWHHFLQPVMGVRCVLEVATALASVVALSLVPIAVVTSLMMTAPLLIAMAAMALRWEPWRKWRVLAAATGLAGSLLVVRPSLDVEVPAVGIVCALLCAVSLAARDLVTRRMAASIPSAAIASATTLAVAIVGGLMGLGEHWRALESHELAALAAAAACAAAGNYALIAACRGVDLSIVTPFRYSIIGWAVLLGYFVWGEVPDLSAMGGIVLIAVAGACAAFWSHHDRGN
jgi:drug/metabolite transporter (DMT)-like permease